MEIGTSQAAKLYQNAVSVAQPEPGTGSGVAQAFVDFKGIVDAGEETAKAAMSGKADPHALVQALAQTELAVEAAVTVRDKVVEAYQEILRMPV